MADLIAIGYEDEEAAGQAEREVERLGDELLIQPDALAVIVRDGDGVYRVQTNHHVVGADTSWGMLWELLFGALFFVPVLGMAVGAGLSALMGKVERIGTDREFEEQVRDMLQPGTSALFLIVEEVAPDKAVEALSQFGGTVLKSSVSRDAEAELQDHLHGAPAAA